MDKVVPCKQEYKVMTQIFLSSKRIRPSTKSLFLAVGKDVSSPKKLSGNVVFLVKIDRSISTDQLKLLLALHFPPIKQVVFL